MAEPPGTACSSPELLYFNELGTRDRCNNELCNPLIGMDGDRMLAQVDQNDFNFSAIISVNRAGRIHKGQTFVECSSTAGP